MATYAELMAQREKIDKQLQDIRRDELERIATEVKALIRASGFSQKEVIVAVTSGVKKPRTKVPEYINKTKTGFRYRDPRDPMNTWGGAGRRPKWIEAYLKQGRKLEEFRI